MHLKRLEAFGFKSFADKVVFDFERGVTGFVGPNGCGKSNVVDAVKWVLGEQSAKSLRGGEMLDVIFNGSSARKALNVAEVTLTFENGSGRLPLNAPEVAVTRRLFRSGESEYFINKAQCRLKDIRELFWDTGIGTSSYSIIEQGRIAALLEANSKERRSLFEEAAGIHKYKERKKLALRKLERVEANLARLTDLLGEVDRNLKTVSRQAEKARKAKEFSDAVRGMKLDLILHDAASAQAALNEASAGLDQANARVTLLTTELGVVAEASASQQARNAELESRLERAQNELNTARMTLQRLETEIESEQRSLGDLDRESARALELSQAASARAAALSAERERVELDAERAQQTLVSHAAQAAAVAEDAMTAQTEREQLAGGLDGARQAAQEATGRRSHLQESLVRAEAELGSLEYKVRRSQAQMTKADDQLKFAQAESEELRKRMGMVSRRREVLENEQSGFRNLQARTEGEIERLTRITQDLQRDLEQRRSRLTALEGLRESGEGLSPGARQVLTATRYELQLENEVHGLVGELLTVEPRLELAIEAALGAHVETLIVESANAARKLSSRLSEQELGRASFLPLDRAEAALFASFGRMVSPGILNAPGCLGCAADLIGCDEQHKVAVQALLSNTLIYESEKAASEAFAADKGSGRWHRVTLQGDCFDACGAISGGKFKAQRLGLIGRKNEISRLGVEMDKLALQINALAERIAFLEKRAQKYARDEERIRGDLSALALSYTELRSTLNAIEREETRSSDERAQAEHEIHELEAERAAHINRVQGMRNEFDIVKKSEHETTAQVRTMEEQLRSRDTSLSELRARSAALERDAAACRERAAALEREGQSLSAQFAERRDESDREARRAQALGERRESIGVALAGKEQSKAQASEEITAFAAQATAIQSEREAARRDADETRGREREVSNELDAARDQLGNLRTLEASLRARLEGKLEQAKAEFAIDAISTLAERGELAPPAEDAHEQLRTLEEKLARLGPVNMAALDELEGLQKRHSFLAVQFEDLDSARTSLRDVISRINRRSRTLFQETFEAVKGQFQEIFRKLFGGGKADLILEDGEDILEAGIEIIARPPGKEPRNVSLLSGGEKTMTMIALLFAIFRSRPAPFCILDEVDAPLDEANVDRFNMMVQEFRDRSQFVIITHNKRTMGYAQTLYGITMPEPGVSKRIAIKFEEIEKHLPAEQLTGTKPVETPAPVVEESQLAPETQPAPVEAPVQETISV